MRHWHLGLAEGLRLWQVTHVLKHHLFRESSHLPSLMVGDTNDWRNQLEQVPFAKHGFVQITTSSVPLPVISRISGDGFAR